MEYMPQYIQYMFGIIKSGLALFLLCFICSEEDLTTSSVRQNSNGPCQQSCPETRRGHLQRIISIEEDHLPHLLQNNCQAQSPLKECSEGEDTSDIEENIDLVMSDIYPSASSVQQQQSKGNVEKRKTPTSPRGQPVGKETSINVSMSISSDKLYVRNACFFTSNE